MRRRGAVAKKAVGEKGKAMELVAVKALVKKAVGDKAKAVEVGAAKSVEEQVCAPKATITMKDFHVHSHHANA